MKVDLKTNKKRLYNELIRLTNSNENSDMLEMLKILFSKFKIIGCRVENSKQKCLCGTFSKHFFVLKNMDNNENCFVGKSCVEYFSSLSKNYEELFRCSSKKMKHLKNKRHNENVLESKNNNNQYFHIFTTYINTKISRMGITYYQFRINKFYVEFIQKLLLHNKKLKYHIWKFNEETYIRFIKTNKRFNKHSDYFIRFNITNGFLMIKFSRIQKPICLFEEM